MPIKNYGVWKATPTGFSAEREEDDAQSPHASLKFQDGISSKKLSSAINIKSLSTDSRLVYWLIQDFQHPLHERLQALDRGWHDISKSDRDLALDLLRLGVVDVRGGKIVPHDVDGANNDIIDFLTPFFDNAISKKATVYIYGEQYSGEDGVHDVHMNQGSDGRFKPSNGIYQDGGIVLEFDDGHCEAFFIAFASQATETDDNGHGTGPTFADMLGTTPPDEGNGGDTPPDNGDDGEEQPDDGHNTDRSKLFIEAALVNPDGPDNQPGGGTELVYIRNGSAEAISLIGVTVENHMGMAHELGSGTNKAIPGNANLGFEVPGVPLSNKGGSIVLRDGQGKVLDEVSYTKEQAARSGALINFA